MLPLSRQSALFNAKADAITKQALRLMRYGVPSLNVKLQAAMDSVAAVSAELSSMSGALPMKLGSTNRREKAQEMLRGSGTGVCRDGISRKTGKMRYKAKAQYKGLAVHLGRYDTPAEARAAYRAFWRDPEGFIQRQNEAWEAKRRKRLELA